MPSEQNLRPLLILNRPQRPVRVVTSSQCVGQPLLSVSLTLFEPSECDDLVLAPSESRIRGSKVDAGICVDAGG